MAKPLKTGTSFKDPNAHAKPAKANAQRHVQRVKAHRQRVKVKKDTLANDPAQITQPLTPKLLAQETAGAVRLRYGQQEAELAGQVRAADRATANSASWFQDYQNAVNAASQRTQAIYAQAAQEQQAYGAQASATDSQNRQQIDSQMQADAAKRGATVDPSIQAMGAQAEASRAAGVGSQLAATSRAGAAQGAYLADQGRIGAGRKVSAMQNEQSKKQSIQAQIAQLKGQEGDYANQYKANARVTERNNQATNAALGIKQQQSALDSVKAQLDQQNKQADRSVRKQNAQETARFHRETAALRQQGLSQTQAKDTYQRRHHLGPYKPPATPKGAKPKAEPQSAVSIKRDISNTIGDYRSKHGTRDKKGRPWTLQRIHADMIAHGVPRDVANSALDLVARGGLSRPNIAALKRAGVHIPRAWLNPPKQPKKPKVSVGVGAKAG